MNMRILDLLLLSATLGSSLAALPITSGWEGIKAGAMLPPLITQPTTIAPTTTLDGFPLISAQQIAGAPIFGPLNTIGTCQVDIMFVLDRSGSIPVAHFANVKTAITDFINLLPDFDPPAASSAAHIGVASFSNTATVEFSVVARERDALLQLVDGIHEVTTGYTNTSSGIAMAQDELLAHTHGSRRMVMIVVTDGKSNRGPDVVAAAQAAKDEGIFIYTVGIGYKVDMAELNQVAELGECPIIPPSNDPRPCDNNPGTGDTCDLCPQSYQLQDTQALMAFAPAMATGVCNTPPLPQQNGE